MKEQQMKTMPILALRGMTLLPGMLVHLDISRGITKKAIEEAMEGDRMVFITLQRDETIESPSYYDLNEIGVIAKIRQELRTKGSSIRVMLATKQRGNLLSLNQTKPFLMGDVVPLEWEEEMGCIGENEQAAMCRDLWDIYGTYLNEYPHAGRSAIEQIRKTEDVGSLTDMIAMHISMDYRKRQEILECVDLQQRFEMVSHYLLDEINIARIRESYRNKVKEEVDKNQKEYFLREQMKVIRQELGSESPDKWIDKYRQQLAELTCSEEVSQRIEEEINRLESISANSSEHVVARNYIETLLALPWDKSSEDNNDILRAEDILEEDHYGLQKVKV